MANKLRVSKSGSGAPTAITPDFLGQIYIDEDTGTRYEATALTKGSWVDKLSLKENVANKKTSLTDDSDTYYPTQKAVKTAVDEKQDTLTFGIANTNAVKVDDASVADNDYAKFTANGIEGVPYSTVLSDIGAQAVLGYTAENTANKKTDLTDNSDTYYPSQKAVKAAVDTKASLASPTFTGTVTLPRTVEIQDTSADHTYNLAVSELTADRTVTLPLLTGNDEFVFKDHTQTLTKKRINPRLVTATSYTTNTGTSLNVSTCDQFEITAQAGDLKFNNPSGTPLGGQKLVIRIKDNGSARALTYDTQFRAVGVELPATTVISKTLYMGFIYNATDTKWDLLAVANEE